MILYVSYSFCFLSADFIRKTSLLSIFVDIHDEEQIEKGQAKSWLIPLRNSLFRPRTKYLIKNYFYDICFFVLSDARHYLYWRITILSCYMCPSFPRYIYYITPVKIIAVSHSLQNLTNQALQNNIFPWGNSRKASNKTIFFTLSFC